MSSTTSSAPAGQPAGPPAASAAGPAPRLRVCSSDVPSGQVQAYFQDHLCRTILQAECRPTADGQPLHFDLTHVALPRAGFTQLKVSPQWVRRSERDIARAQGEHVVVMVQHEGTSLIHSLAGELRLRAGDVVVLPDWRPSVVTAGRPIAQSVHMLPREAAVRMAPFLADLQGFHVDRNRPESRLIHAADQALRQALEADSASPLQALDHLQQCLLHAMASAAGQRPDARPAVELEASHWTRVGLYLQSHLSRRGLAAVEVAQAVGLSVSQLHRLHQSHGTTLGTRLRELRIQAACAELADPLKARWSLRVIAERAGFADGAHFAHAFKAVTGQAPSQWRREQRPAGVGSDKAVRV